ncbi:hypothetical protein R1sor_006688 [Riccia sorocarpa]|uniref:Uncharacterized protein n=1 Tax=Riccia sorocarpa TaxID=122646 RepID=A0ABD3HR56_9MARC
MPLAPTTLPPWVYRTGCEVAEDGTGEGLDALERLCRQFLWGWKEHNNPKTSLVAWERIAQSRQDGGLGWIKYREKAAALHIKCVLKLLTGEET